MLLLVIHPLGVTQFILLFCDCTELMVVWCQLTAIVVYDPDPFQSTLRFLNKQKCPPCSQMVCVLTSYLLSPRVVQGSFRSGVFKCCIAVRSLFILFSPSIIARSPCKQHGTRWAVNRFQRYSLQFAIFKVRVKGRSLPSFHVSLLVDTLTSGICGKFMAYNVAIRGVRGSWSFPLVFSMLHCLDFVLVLICRYLSISFIDKIDC